MKKNLLLLATGLFIGVNSYAGSMGNVQNKCSKDENSIYSYIKGINSAIFYNYSDFKYNGQQTTRGHADFYGVGGDKSFSQNVAAGLYIYRSNVSSFANITQEVTTDAFFGHILNQVYPDVFIDLAAGYGASDYNMHIDDLAYSHSLGDTYFGSITGYYYKNYESILVNTNARLLYNITETDKANLIFTSGDTQSIESTSTKYIFSMENIELTYNSENSIRPFVNAGLVQVLSSSQNNTFVPANTPGSLLFDENGYTVGGGLNFNYGNFSGRLEYTYYNANDVFKRQQTMAILKYRFV